MVQRPTPEALARARQIQNAMIQRETAKIERLAANIKALRAKKRQLKYVLGESTTADLDYFFEVSARLQKAEEAFRAEYQRLDRIL